MKAKPTAYAQNKTNKEGQRAYLVNGYGRWWLRSPGKKQTFAFDLDAFVSYNVDTRELTLMNGRVYVHADSEDDLIRAYRRLDDDEDVDMSG